MRSPAEDIRHAVETVCGAKLLSEKLSLFEDAREFLAGPLYETWLHDLFVTDDDERVVEWLADSLPTPGAFLAKFLLFRGFYRSDSTDLRAYALAMLSLLTADAAHEADVLSPVPLFPSAAPRGRLM